MTTRRRLQPRETNVPRTREERNIRRAAAEVERREGQRREALEAVRPFMDDEGKVDIVAFLDSGGSAQVLERLIPAERVAQGQDVRSILQELRPYRDEEGRVDILAALEGGVSPERLNRVFEGESVTAAQDIRTARSELGDRSPVEFIRGGGSPDTLRTLGVDDTTVDALVEVRPFLTEQGNINAAAASFGGVSEDTLRTLGVTPAANRFIRDAQRLQEIESGEARRREVIQASVRRIQQATGVSPGDVGLDPTSPGFNDQTFFQRAVARRAQELGLPPKGPGNTQGDINRRVVGASSFQRFIRPVTDPIIERFQEERNEIINRYEKSPQAIIDAAQRGVELPPIGVGVSDEPETAIAAERFPEGTRFQIRDPETGESRGFAAGQQAVDAARAQGFQVVPVTIERRAEPLAAGGPEEPVPPPIPQIGRFPAPEEDFPAPDAPLIERLPPQQRRALERLVELGYADQQGRTDLAGAADAGLQAVLIQAGFTQQDITAAREGQFRSEVAAERLARQAFDPGAQLARDRLEQMGFASDEGVFVGQAALEGQRDLLLRAGFTPGQIDAAVQQLTIPTAEPRPRPAPGETLPVPEDLQRKLENAREQLGDIPQAPVPAAPGPLSTNPQEIAATRRVNLINGIIAGVESGDLSPDQARELISEIPKEATPEDISVAERRIGRTLQALGIAPVIGIPLSATGTAITFAEDTPVERGLNIGLDVVSLVPLATVGVAGARTAGAARGFTRLRAVGREVTAAELSIPTSPREFIRGTIADPIEAVVRPGRLVGQEETFTTLRIPAEPGAARVSTIAPEPAETIRQIRAGELTGADMKEAVSDAAIEVMQTGRTATREVADTGTLVTVRAGATHRVLGGAAFHATPDGRNIMAGPITVSGRESGLFVAPTPMTRFAEATAFGSDVPLTPQARAAVAAGNLPSQPVPTVILIRDPNLLAKLQGATGAAGEPKIFRHLAEVEGVLPNGTVIPRASQVRFMRDAAGRRVAVAVVGDPLTAAEQARLKVSGIAQATRNVFRPGAVVQFQGRSDVRAALKGTFLSDSADTLLAEARQLRRAGRITEALELERTAARVGRRGQQLTSATPARLPFGPVEGGIDDGRLERTRVTPDDSSVLPGIRPAVSPDRDRVRAADAVGRGPEISPRQVSSRLTTLTRLATAARSGPLSESQRRQAQRAVEDLRRSTLTDPQRARAEANAEAVRARVPDLPRVTTEPRAPRVPELPRVPRTPEAPRVPSAPRVPGVPRVPESPRVPRVPEVPETPRPTGEGPAPSPDSLARDTEGRLNVRVVGIQRGAVGDTSIDMVTGETRTVKDIDAVPARPTKQSFTILRFNSQAPTPQRLPWGAKDMILWPDGTKKFIKAGAPLPPKPGNGGRPSRNRIRGPRL